MAEREAPSAKEPPQGLRRVRFAMLWLGAAILISAPAANAASLTIDIAASGGATGSVTGGANVDEGGQLFDCSGPPASGQCSATFEETYPPQLFLTATPGPGSVFAGWSGAPPSFIPEDNCQGLLSSCMVWLGSEETRTLTATFAPSDAGGDCDPDDGAMGRYIVVFYDWVDDPEPVARAQVEKYGGTLGFIYRYALKGYSAEYPVAAVPALEGEPSVKYVEEDQIVELFGVSAATASSIGGDGCAEGPEEPTGDPDEPACAIPEGCPEDETPGDDLDSPVCALPEGCSDEPTDPSPFADESACQLPESCESLRSSASSPRKCRKGTVPRGNRCVRKRGSARRPCRKAIRAAKQRCLRRLG